MDVPIVRVSFWRLTTLAVVITGLVFFWNSVWLLPFKVFVVYLHELSHGLGSILTGGSVQTLSISWDESGRVHAPGGIFFVTALSGYAGSMLFGSAMTWTGLQGTGHRLTGLLIAILLVVFTFLPQDNPSDPGVAPRYIIGLLWGIALIITSLFYPRANRFLLFLLGGITISYALYDLDDFFSGQIMQTDAGIVASAYLSGFPESTRLAAAWIIAGLIILITVRILLMILPHAISRRIPAEQEEAPEGAVEYIKSIKAGREESI